MKKTPIFLSILLMLTLSLGLFCLPSAPVKAEAKEGPINLYTRDSASGTREGFEGVIDFKGELADTANEVTSNGDMAAKVGQDPNGIGYVSLSTDFEANNLHPVAYEGVEPTVENTVSGDYALARPFVFATRAAEDFESPEKAQLVEAFITFMTKSTEGLETILAAGGIVDVNAGTPWEELKKDYPIVDQDNSALEISTVGSTSVEKVVQAGLEAFQPLAGNFQMRMNQTGSGDGWKRVLGDEKDGPNKGDIGFASRYFHEDEVTDKSDMTGLLCQDAIVVVTHKDNAVKNLTKAQLYDIFTGVVANWEDIK